MERVPQEDGAAGAREAGRARAGRVRRAAAGGGVLVVVAALAYWLGGGGSGGDDRAGGGPGGTPTPTATLTVPDVFRRVGPSVVVIQAGRSLGTGVIAAEDGTILTAHHVVKSAKDIDLTFADGTRAKAVVATANPKRDVAVLKPVRLPEIVVPATLGGAVAVGAPVVAIGNPLGLTYSVSTGVVSGLDRTTGRTGKDAGLNGLIQFDASVNPGSSGGPLLDARGLVVGIVVSIADPGGDDAFAGIAFAVPIGAALGGDDGDGPPGDGPQI
ncbi:S1C family serine protease [Nonomuraea sp. NPDC049646]|uniref:S1C family serine protease n=1 Tax=unclassified Nonomuraea TaxID=2593643 RepID=UPI0037AAA0CB